MRSFVGNPQFSRKSRDSCRFTCGVQQCSLVTREKRLAHQRVYEEKLPAVQFDSANFKVSVYTMVVQVSI